MDDHCCLRSKRGRTCLHQDILAAQKWQANNRGALRPSRAKQETFERDCDHNADVEGLDAQRQLRELGYGRTPARHVDY